MSDYYSVLGLRADADDHSIKKAYRALALKLHPDKTGSKDTDRFREVKEAYETLIDPDRRKDYDRLSKLHSQSGRYEQHSQSSPYETRFRYEQHSQFSSYETDSRRPRHHEASFRPRSRSRSSSRSGSPSRRHSRRHSHRHSRRPSEPKRGDPHFDRHSKRNTFHSSESHWYGEHHGFNFQEQLWQQVLDLGVKARSELDREASLLNFHAQRRKDMAALVAAREQNLAWWERFYGAVLSDFLELMERTQRREWERDDSVREYERKEATARDEASEQAGATIRKSAAIEEFDSWRRKIHAEYINLVNAFPPGPHHTEGLRLLADSDHKMKTLRGSFVDELERIERLDVRIAHQTRRERSLIALRKRIDSVFPEAYPLTADMLHSVHEVQRLFLTLISAFARRDTRAADCTLDAVVRFQHDEERRFRQLRGSPYARTGARAEPAQTSDIHMRYERFKREQSTEEPVPPYARAGARAEPARKSDIHMKYERWERENSTEVPHDERPPRRHSVRRDDDGDVKMTGASRRRVSIRTRTRHYYG